MLSIEEIKQVYAEGYRDSHESGLMAVIAAVEGVIRAEYHAATDDTNPVVEPGVGTLAGGLPSMTPDDTTKAKDE